MCTMYVLTDSYTHISIHMLIYIHLHINRYLHTSVYTCVYEFKNLFEKKKWVNFTKLFYSSANFYYEKIYNLITLQICFKFSKTLIRFTDISQTKILCVNVYIQIHLCIVHMNMCLHTWMHTHFMHIYTTKIPSYTHIQIILYTYDKSEKAERVVLTTHFAFII